METIIEKDKEYRFNALLEGLHQGCNQPLFPQYHQIITLHEGYSVN